MENQPPKKRLTASIGNDLINYRIKKAPCEFCIEFKEIIERQSQQIKKMIADQKLLAENLAKLQATTENQNKIIVEMMADQKGMLQSMYKSRQSLSAITKSFPLKSEEDIHEMEEGIDTANEQNYVSAINMLLEGSTSKNLEKIFSREICMEFNTDGISGKKRLRDYRKLYNVVLDAIHKYSPNAEKELKTAIQVVKKRHFRAAWFTKQKGGQLSQQEACDTHSDTCSSNA